MNIPQIPRFTLTFIVPKFGPKLTIRESIRRDNLQSLERYAWMRCGEQPWPWGQILAAVGLIAAGALVGVELVHALFPRVFG